jgi:putative DNA methylase
MSNYRKKLIEVALPLKAINEASAREKSIRHGHPSTLHLWWARRPLAACRAVLFASLVDDPDSDPEFRALGEEMAGKKRADLFNLIEELVQWENSNHPDVIRSARAEIARCVASRLVETGKLARDQVIADGITASQFIFSCNCRSINGGFDAKAGRVRYAFDTRNLPPAAVVDQFLAEHAPPVLDPFCGGGSIPLEAQRLGLRAYASDLNPVPVLITKALIEIPPKFAGRQPVNPEWQAKSEGEKATTVWHGAQGLAEDVRYYGQWMRDEAEKRIGHLYPKVKITKEIAKDRPDLEEYVGQELTVIAWLWARTVASPNPVCEGTHVPLVRSFWLSTKPRKKAWIEPIIDLTGLTYQFQIRCGLGEPRPGTVGKKGDTCLLTGSVITRAYIRDQAQAGRMDVRLLAIVAEGHSERVFLAPTVEQEQTAHAAHPPTDLFDTDIIGDSRYLTPTSYGMRKHQQLFTARQLVTLSIFSDLVCEARRRILSDCKAHIPYADAVATYLAFALDRVVDRHSCIATWDSSPSKLQLRNTFARQALQMTWDFGEGNPFSMSSGSWTPSVEFVAKAVLGLPSSGISSVRQLNASDIEGGGFCFSTDPPYYDNVPYADLSDFFYIWLRRALQPVYPNLLTTVLVPKSEELVADPFRHGGKNEAKAFFERGMQRVLERMRGANDSDAPATVYYAFKQTEDNDTKEVDSDHTRGLRSSTGWETFLQGLNDTGWQLTGTWPMRTELGNRMRSMASNALASSIVLVCRPRPINAALTTRKQFMNTLRHELPDSLKKLQHGNIAPVDMAQAAIGPGMAVFTRYSKVIETDGSPMPVRTALGIINQVLDEVLAEQEGDFDAATRWALAWFEQFGKAEGLFGVAETLSKAKNTAVNGLVEAAIIKARGGKVQLIGRDALPDDWDPATDNRLTAWETTQHLIHTLEKKGEAEAAALLNRLGGMAETARELAYRLYSICERKKWADEALAYNGLVIAWPELTKLALSQRTRQSSTQQELF